MGSENAKPAVARNTESASENTTEDAPPRRGRAAVGLPEPSTAVVEQYAAALTAAETRIRNQEPTGQIHPTTSQRRGIRRSAVDQHRYHQSWRTPSVDSREQQLRLTPSADFPQLDRQLLLDVDH